MTERDIILDKGWKKLKNFVSLKIIVMLK